MAEIEAYPTTGEKGLVNYRHWNAACDHGFRKDFSYMIYPAGSVYKALNGDTGTIDFNDADAATVIQAAIDALTSGGKIFIEQAVYTCTAKLTLGGGILVDSDWATLDFSGISDYAIDVISESPAQFPQPEYATGACLSHLIVKGGTNSKGVRFTESIYSKILDDVIIWAHHGDSGLYLVGCIGCEVSDVWLVSNKYGLVMEKSATLDYNSNIFRNVHFHDSLLSGMWLTTAGAGNLFLKCIFENNAGYGITIEDSHRNAFDTCWWELNGGRDVNLRLTDSTRAIGNHFVNCYFSPSTAINIYADGDTNTYVEGCQIDDIYFSANSQYPWIINNDLNTVSISAFNPHIYGNRGYITENSGIATITDSTTVVFAHGLAGTPTKVNVGFKTAGYGSWIWSADETNITITVANSGTYDLTWDAEYAP